MARHIEKAEQVIDRNEINEEGLNRLRAAIVHQAVDDYTSTLRKLKRKPKDKALLQEKKELEKFFRSEWFSALCDCDGERVMKAIQEKVCKAG